MESDGILKHIVFSPSKSVASLVRKRETNSSQITFQPVLAKQKTECEITNNSSTAVIVKWKLTRPGSFRTIPTYSIIKAGESATTTLICVGITKKEAAINRDRFSIIVAPISQTDMLPKSIWKDQEALKKLSVGKIQKKMIFILYAGINENMNLDNAETIQDVNDSAENEAKEDVMESWKGSQKSDDNLNTTRTAGKFTSLLIPIAQLASSPETAKSPSG